MNKIALSLLLLFTTFTVVLSTYYLWQNNNVMVMMPVEEEEDHHVKCYALSSFPAGSFDSDLNLCYLLGKTEIIAVAEENFYEDVYQNSPYSPPDLMLCA